MSRPKILVIQTAFLGDLLLSIPLLNNIRKNFPEVELHLLCRKGLGNLFKQLKIVDHFYEVQKGSNQSYEKLYQELKVFEFEKIFCPHMSLRSARLVGRLHAGEKIGFKTWWNFLFFDQRIKKDLKLPEALRQLSLLSGFDSEIQSQIFNHKETAEIKTIGTTREQFLSAVPEFAVTDVSNFLPSAIWPNDYFGIDLNSPFICIFPGSVWGTKRWTEEGFVQLILKALDQGLSVLLMGSKEEKELCQKINSQVEFILKNQSTSKGPSLATKGVIQKNNKANSVINLAGITDWIQTLNLLKKSSCVVSNDSGGQHLAALVSAPTVGIFGPTVISFGFRPWNSNAVILETNNLLKCRPCGKHGPQVCPMGTHQCMKDVTVDAVWDAIVELLNR